MNYINRSDYLAGGYFLTRTAERPSFISKDFFPDRLISASRCVAPMIPCSWYGNWITNSGAPDQRTLLDTWIVDHLGKDIDLNNVFFQTKTAADFAAKFCPEDDDLFILGIGLHRDIVQSYLLGDQRWRIGERTEGISSMLRNDMLLQSGGNSLGFEILAQEYNELLSWLCGGVYVAAFELSYGHCRIRPNKFGFLNTFDDAQLYAKYIRHYYDRDGVDLWLPWLVVKYELSEIAKQASSTVLQDRVKQAIEDIEDLSVSQKDDY